LALSRNSARFFWKSLPQEVKGARPELAAIWRIGQCLWNRDYAGVYTAAQGFEWGPDIADFIAAFLGIVLVLSKEEFKWPNALFV
jgi:COP9 signalosome complex subunit 8